MNDLEQQNNSNNTFLAIAFASFHISKTQVSFPASVKWFPFVLYSHLLFMRLDSQDNQKLLS